MGQQEEKKKKNDRCPLLSLTGVLVVDGAVSGEDIEAVPLIVETAEREYCTALPDRAEEGTINLRMSLDVVCKRLNWVDGNAVV